MPAMGTATRKRKKKTFIPHLLVLSLLSLTAFASISYFKNLWSDGAGIVGMLDSPVLKLASLQPVERANTLSDIVIQGGDKANVSRAKYVLATDLIQQDQGSKALRYLDKLEDRKSTRLNSSHVSQSRMPSSA